MITSCFHYVDVYWSRCVESYDHYGESLLFSLYNGTFVSNLSWYPLFPWKRYVLFLWPRSLVGCRKKPPRKNKTPFSCSESGGGKFNAAGWIRNASSIFNRSVGPPAAERLFVSQRRVFLSAAAELLDQGRGSHRGRPDAAGKQQNN